MRMARVAGDVVATIKDPVMEDRRVLVCDYLDDRGRATGEYVLALDPISAGPGEVVLVLDEGNGARQVLDEPDGAVRAVVVGIVELVTVDGEPVELG